MQIFILGASEPVAGRLPTALHKINFSSTVLDWQINSFISLKPIKINYLGGYLIEDIISSYPNLNYVNITNWKSKPLLNTLLKATFQKSPSLIIYADTIFRHSVVEEIKSKDSDIVVAIDPNYKDRYVDRPISDIKKAEIIKPISGKYKNIKCEFSGLIRFSKEISNKLNKLNYKKVGNNLLDLTSYFIKSGFTIEYVDCSHNWAELNEPGDISKFILGTKADTLLRLSPMGTKFKIGKQISFYVDEWKNHKSVIYKKIKTQFPNTLLAIRSSSAEEDSWDQSNAGKFTSLLNIASNSQIAIKNAVNKVIDSYKNKNQKNQILIQEHLSDVLISGVIFTVNIESGAPYFIVNYDDITGTTDKITSGSLRNSKTIIIYQHLNYSLKKIKPRIKKIIEAAKEISKLLSFDKLDIEFAITKENKVIIFQVRPICIDHRNYEEFFPKIPKFLKAVSRKFKSLTESRKTIFSNMADWNPAEMIGTYPKPLALSLYQELITNKVWAKQRAEFGYSKVSSKPLLIDFCGQPYIDVERSFNSFIPSKISPNLKKKMINAYITYLKSNPLLHDKIEFDVVFTIWTPCFLKEAKNRLEKYNISSKEIKLIETELIKITKLAFKNFEYHLSDINNLVQKREKLKNMPLQKLEKAIILLNDCKQHGILPFAHAARHAFVSKSFLKSFENKKLLSKERINEFMQSIRTITSELFNDQIKLINKELSINEIKKKYGHLRPGTYDALTPSYAEKPLLYFVQDKRKFNNIKDEKKDFILSQAEIFKIEKSLKLAKWKITANDLFNYFRKSIIAREWIKFEFTKNISMAIENIIGFGNKINIPRNKIIFLNFSDLKAYKYGLKNSDDLNKIIKKREEEYSINKIISLPSFIESLDDFIYFEQGFAEANFVTNKSIVANTVDLVESLSKELTKSIVLIEQADPGFDWIFSHDITGLITQYGGANSHMAIRAAELDLPAAIGVGEKFFKNLKKTNLIKLDCENKSINIIS